MKNIVYLFMSVLTAVQCYVPSVVYVSFQINESSTYNASNDISIIETSDDTPLVEIQLPSLFPFFGQFIDRVFVSPNGYAQTSPVNLCRCCYCPPCLVDYFGMIAGILADLNTYDNELAYVGLQRDEFNVTTIYYHQLNYFSYIDQRLDFGIRLFPDGAINIIYDNVTHFDTLGSEYSKCSWLSGLIGPNASQPDGVSWKVTEEQKRVQESEWNARNTGVYPPSRSGVHSGSQFNLCPISSVWGCVPSVIDNTTAVLNITALSMSCIADAHSLNHSINIAILFSTAATTVNSDSNLDVDFIAECEPVRTFLTLEPSPVAFTCDLSSINISYFMKPDSGSVFVYILWKPSKDSMTATGMTALADYRLIGSPTEVPPLVVNCSSKSVAGALSGPQCALNAVVGSCTACEVVYSGFKNLDATQQADLTTCLSLDCPLDDAVLTSDAYSTSASFSSFSSLTSYQTLYMRPSCYHESCEATFEYDLDQQFDCCLISDMDCMGVCNGTSVAGRDMNNGWMKCCDARQPPDCLGYCGGQAVNDCFGNCDGTAILDCLGVCNGTALLDACGICNGNSAVDCLGICNGTAVVDCFGLCDGSAVVDCLGSCNGTAVLDCLGDCNGTAVVDTCGVCGGSDMFFCPRLNISVDTGSNFLNSNHHLWAEYDASNPQFVSKVPVVVSNTNNVALEIYFTFPEEQLLPPFITLPTDVYHINPFSNMSFDIFSNISELFTQHDSWAVNTFDVIYSRVSSHLEFDSYVYAIDVLPFMNNCSNLTTIDTCTTFPGCIFCLGLPASGEIRVLTSATAISHRENDDKEEVARMRRAGGLEYYYGNANIYNIDYGNDNSNDKRNRLEDRNKEVGSSGVPANFARRTLYSNIVPIYRDSITDEEVFSGGYCRSGLTSEEACPALSSSGSTSSHPLSRSSSSFKTLCTQMCRALISITILNIIF